MKHQALSVLLWSLMMVSTLGAQDLGSFFSDSDAFLKAHVENGLVKYAAIKEDPAALESLLAKARAITVAKEDVANYQAFWINAYNLLVIKGVVDHYPIKSPLDVAGFFDKITYDVGGKQVTLNDLEHKLLRGNFPKEARFHFVLVCAGLGCPPIINAAYRPNTLETQLQEQTVKALNDANFIQVGKKRVGISQLFNWYKEDFVHNGSILDFINAYRSEKLPEKAKLSFYEYDWTLNQTK
ncbi:DUF547 domain-containing protein [Maribacter sp. 2307ULW6-5]|uniref:DUF547 domain-containing protein n=1 Tax=Maribacter sp. 2307ULW6-5 TaxID=3386275 RepID=UPI0039BC46AD